MAPVNRPDGNRGQLILVGGLALAVTLVALALVLNTVIFTGNLASRDVDAGVDEAVAFQEAARNTVGNLIDTAASRGGSYASQEDFVAESVADFGEQLPGYGAAVGASTAVTYVDSTAGRRLHQPSERAFSSESGAEDWQVVGTTDHLRRFRFDVDPGPTLSIGDVSLSDTFQVRFDGPTTYRLYVYEESGGIEVRVEGGGTSRTCLDPSGGMTRVDVTGATLGGVECPALSFLDDIGGPYDVHFVNGDAAEGRWSMVAPASSVTASTYDGSGEPDADPAVYESRVRVSFRGADVSFDGIIRVAPGEQGPVGELGPTDAAGGGGLTPTPTPSGTPSPSGPVDPTIDASSYTANNEEDASGSKDRIEYTVDWSVGDDNGNLDEVTVKLIRDVNGQTVSNRESVSGSSASGDITVSYLKNNVCGEEFDVVLTVEDSTGRTTTETKEVTATCTT